MMLIPKTQVASVQMTQGQDNFLHWDSRLRSAYWASLADHLPAFEVVLLTNCTKANVKAMETNHDMGIEQTSQTIPLPSKISPADKLFGGEGKCAGSGKSHSIRQARKAVLLRSTIPLANKLYGRVELQVVQTIHDAGIRQAF